MAVACIERLCEKSVMILNNYSCGWSVTSMNHRTGLDRSQTLLFPERLEDYVGAENPARFPDAFVGMLYCRDNINNDRGLFCRSDFIH